jgi:hypothetical protein
MVLDGHLVPVDVRPEVTSRIAESKATPPAPAPNSIEAVREALRAARERHGVTTPEEVPEAPQKAPEEVSEDLAGVAVEAETPPLSGDPEPSEDSDSTPSESPEGEPVRPRPKKRAGNQRKGY